MVTKTQTISHLKRTYEPPKRKYLNITTICKHLYNIGGLVDKEIYMLKLQILEFQSFRGKK